MKKKLYFLGGAANQLGSQVSQQLGAGQQTSELIGNSVQLGTGLAELAAGSPTGVQDILQGGMGTITGGITNATNTLNNSKAGAVDKLAAIGGIFNPGIAIASSINNDKLAKVQESQDQFNNLIKSNMEKGGYLTQFNTGGTHEENSIGGIPQGMSPEGDMNTVEEKETKWEDYIFSDRLKVDKDLSAQFKLPKGVSFASLSKKYNKELEDRPNDTITKETVAAHMNNLMSANDAARYKSEVMDETAFRCGGKMYYKGGKIQEGDFDVEDLSEEEILYLNKLGYDVEII